MDAGLIAATLGGYSLFKDVVTRIKDRKGDVNIDEIQIIMLAKMGNEMYELNDTMKNYLKDFKKVRRTITDIRLHQIKDSG